MSIPDLLYEQVYLGEKTMDDILASANVNANSAVHGAVHGAAHSAEASHDAARKMEEIAASNRAILDAYPADQMKAAVLRKLAAGSAEERSGRSERSESNDSRILAFPHTERIKTLRFAALAAAACAVIAVSVATVNRRAETGEFAGTGVLESATRVKGSGAKLYVYRKEGDKATLLSAGDKVKQNDILQLSYVAGGDLYGAIISVDGNGTVTRHFPDSGDTAAKLEQSGEIPLGFSYQLDNAPRFERFILITGPKPFPIDDAASEIGRSVRNGFSPSFDLSVFLPSRTKATDILLIK